VKGQVRIADFVRDEALLGPWFRGSSWSAWMTVLKGALGEPMSVTERARFVELAEREPPERRVREAWFLIERRGGKTASPRGWRFTVPWWAIGCRICDRASAPQLFVWRLTAYRLQSFFVTSGHISSWYRY